MTGGRSRYLWFVGVVLVLFLGYVTLNTASTRRASSTGPPAGKRLPPFAVPLASSPLAPDADANVATRPGQGQAGNRPACRVRGPQILNVCQLAERGPVALAFLATRGGQCVAELDRLERVRRAFRGLQVAAVSIKGDPGDVARLARGHAWGFPVGYDRDGVLANLYGVAVCPQLTFAYPGGVVRSTALGQLGEAALRGRLAALLAASRRRGWRPPGG